MTKTFTADDFLEFINRLDGILENGGGDNKAQEVNADETSSKEIAQIERDAFEKEFNRNHILMAFTDAVAAVMTISSITGMDLDKTLELFIGKMRDELHAEDTKVIMDIRDDIVRLFNLLSGKGD